MIDPSHTLVVGLGLAGQAVARAVVARGGSVAVVEDRPVDMHRAFAADVGVALLEAPDARSIEQSVAAASLIVPSPGVGDAHPVFAAATKCNRSVVSEFDLAQLWDSRPLVAITGTDGKTTVNTMVLDMINSSGIVAVDAGNNDLPLVTAIDDPDTEVFVVEASSFRLGRSVGFSPAVGTWLNWGPDHLDVHSSLEEYEQAKAKIWTHLPADGVAVVNVDDPVVLRNAPSHGVVTVSTIVDADFDVHDQQLRARGEVLVSVADLPRSLPHDVANGLAAAATALSAGADIDAVRQVLRTFEGLEHRVQFVAEIDGVSYFNDSKATTPHAVAAAVRGFDDAVLIAGGRNKGLDLGPLADLVPHLRTVVATGDAADEIVAVFGDQIDVLRAASMDEAIELATAAAGAGVVLLSPGCTSYDWYKNYGERGHDFMNLVLARNEQT